jgi:hypothetical protein
MFEIVLSYDQLAAGILHLFGGRVQRSSSSFKAFVFIGLLLKFFLIRMHLVQL